MSFTQKLVGAARMPGIAWSFSRLGYRRRRRTFDASDLDVSLAGKQCVVTGANSGIGFAVAEALARRHADVWLLCRNAGRARDARQRLADVGDGCVRVEIVDMTKLDSIAQVLTRIDVPRVDVLVHNAGALVHEYSETAPGLETTVACHVVGPQKLTHGLAEQLHASTDPRVIYVSSGGMYSERLDVDALFTPPLPYDGVRAYALAKRAQVVLTEQWAEHMPAIRFYAMHPGWADTAGVQKALPRFYRRTKRWLRTTSEGADSAVWLAAAPTLEIPSGAFVFDRSEAPRHLLPNTRTDHPQRSRLWRRVEELAHQTESRERRLPR
jgi:dehydrogenase/reductase SDR family protein 12